MFSSGKLAKLKGLKNVDIQVNPTKFDKESVVVTAKVTVFDPEKTLPNNNPMIVKSVTATAEGKTLKVAQEDALILAEDLLGEL